MYLSQAVKVSYKCRAMVATQRGVRTKAIELNIYGNLEGGVVPL